MQAVISANPGAAVGRRARSGFFSAMAIALLLVVVVGFAPTFFLRSFFDVPAVPGYVLVHGVVTTAWLMWFLLQSVLVRTARISLHRRMGVAGMWLASAVVAMGLIATVGNVARQSPVDQEIIAVTWLSLYLLLDFSLCTLAAFVWRRRPDVHKRLMVFASTSLIGPAFGRIATWSVVGDFGGLINAMPALFLVAIVTHDVVERRRLHVVTAIAGGFRLVSLAMVARVADSDFGRAFVLGLS